MEYIIWYFFSITYICLFCLGWRTITDKGKVLYFIREHFESRVIDEEVIIYEDWNKLSAENKKLYIPSKVTGNTASIKYHRPVYSIVPWWSQPLVKCVSCMPSFWGTLLYWNLFYLAHVKCSCIEFDVALFLYIPIIISCSFINGLYWKKYSS